MTEYDSREIQDDPPSLDATLSLPKVHDFTSPITNDLDFDVFPARTSERFLDEKLLRGTFPQTPEEDVNVKLCST